MAKTLIGNVKGKDGRGISKIEKTSTTGVVDTYTITYTDSTQSTYEVRNSDAISVQRQIVPSAAVESSSTASQPYAAGDYVVVNGTLRKVTAAIAKGNAISDSNSAATTVTGEIATITDWVYLYGQNAGDKVRYRRHGTMAEMQWSYIQETASSWKAGNIPVTLRPTVGVAGACMRCDKDGKPTNNVATYDVRDNGDVYFTTNNQQDKGSVVGYCCWPIG